MLTAILSLLGAAALGGLLWWIKRHAKQEEAESAGKAKVEANREAYETARKTAEIVSRPDIADRNELIERLQGKYRD